jgi:hypothetical protein
LASTSRSQQTRVPCASASHHLPTSPWRDNRIRGGSEEWITYLDVGIGVMSALLIEHGDELSSRGWVLLDNGDLTVEQTVTAIRSLNALAAD